MNISLGSSPIAPPPTQLMTQFSLPPKSPLLASSQKHKPENLQSDSQPGAKRRQGWPEAKDSRPSPPHQESAERNDASPKHTAVSLPSRGKDSRPSPPPQESAERNDALPKYAAVSFSPRGKDSRLLPPPQKSDERNGASPEHAESDEIDGNTDILTSNTNPSDPGNCWLQAVRT